MLPKPLIWHVLFLSFGLSMGCQTTQQKTFGVSPDFIAHIPARIAVMSCLNLDDQESVDVSSPLCTAYDKFVTTGFTDQKFMRGYSVSAVQQLLKRANQSQLSTGWQSFFSPLQGRQKTAAEVIAFYKKHVQTNPEWRHWLLQLSQNTRLSDAVLLPFIADAIKIESQNHSLNIVTKTADILSLLIDTETGHLIWTGGRRASMSHSTLVGPQAKAPSLEDLESRLFFSDHWLEFPGRVQ